MGLLSVGGAFNQKMAKLHQKQSSAYTNQVLLLVHAAFANWRAVPSFNPSLRGTKTHSVLPCKFLRVQKMPSMIHIFLRQICRDSTGNSASHFQPFVPSSALGILFFFLHRMTSVTKKTMMPLIYMFQTGLRPGWKVGIWHYQWLQNLWHSRSPRKARLRSSCMILLLPKTIGYSSLSSSFRNARFVYLLMPARA